jgi:hypothetical protein
MKKLLVEITQEDGKKGKASAGLERRPEIRFRLFAVRCLRET